MSVNKKAGIYNLVVDESRSDMITAMISVFLSSGAINEFLDKAKEKGVIKTTDEDIDSFLKDLSKMTHEMGWCKDSSCRLDNKPKKQYD